MPVWLSLSSLQGSYHLNIATVCPAGKARFPSVTFAATGFDTEAVFNIVVVEEERHIGRRGWWWAPFGRLSAGNRTAC